MPLCLRNFQPVSGVQHSSELCSPDRRRVQSGLDFHQNQVKQEEQVHSLCVDSRPGDRLRLAKGPPPSSSLHHSVNVKISSGHFFLTKFFIANNFFWQGINLQDIDLLFVEKLCSAHYMRIKNYPHITYTRIKTLLLQTQVRT